ncbi:MAG: SpoIIIAH-like family protein [Clostridia bacterium]|nr:SpoIIIAH-like family protein [Clostridia bacterium]
MEIKQKFLKLKEKVTHIKWKELVATKAFITVGCLVLVCVAVLVSSLVNENMDITAGNESGENRVLGNTILVDASANESDQSQENNQSSTESGDQSADSNVNQELNGEDFFAMAILNRTQVRDSALEVLRQIAENPDAMPDAKEEALSSIAAIAEDMSIEANIETLIEAKGISQCVAVISGNNCSVIVNKSDLTPTVLTQITDIVYDQAGIPVANVTVVEAE